MIFKRPRQVGFLKCCGLLSAIYWYPAQHFANQPYIPFNQTSELSRRIHEAEKDVQRLVSQELEEEGNKKPRSLAESATSDPESQQQKRDPYAQDTGSDDDITDEEGDDSGDESFDALEERFHGLEEEVANLVADVHDLALYTKLNITGFMKILKVRLTHARLSHRSF